MFCNIKELTKKQKIIICASAAAVAVIAAIITVIIFVHTVKNPPENILGTDNSTSSNKYTSSLSQFENSSDVFIPDTSITITPEGSNQKVDEIVEAVDKIEQTTQNTVVVKDNSIDASNLSKKQVKLDVKYVPQNPELPTGCEITALTTVLNYYGYNVSKTEMADNYLEKSVNGLGDFWEVFVGNPRKNGFGCYAKPIVKAANKYLATQNSEYMAYNYSGAEFEDLLKTVESGTPVIIWSTMYGRKTRDLLEPYSTAKWTVGGKTIQWIAPEHCMVLIGYDIDRNIAVMSDPQRGIVEYNLETVKARYLAIHSQCVVLLEQTPTISGVKDGETYYTSQHVAISSNSAVTVTVNGRKTTTSFLISGNTENTYVIKATGVNGKSTTCTVHTKNISSLAEEINDLNKYTVTENDLERVNNLKDKLFKISTEYASSSESKAINDILMICDNLINNISEIKVECDRVINLAKQYEEKFPTVSDSDTIIGLSEDITALLASKNLTEDRRNVLTKLKAKCNDWLSSFAPIEPVEPTESIE